MLGHTSGTTTRDLYGHLLGDRLDEVPDALDAGERSELGPRPEQGVRVANPRPTEEGVRVAKPPPAPTKEAQ